jgi:hypothetical protein
MPRNPQHADTLDPTGTDEHPDALAGGDDEKDPYADPLAVMLGASPDGTEDDTATDTDSDDAADAAVDAEEDAEDSADSEDETSGEEDGTDETEDEDPAAEGDDKDEDEDAETAAKNAKWKAQFDKLTPEAQRIVMGQREALLKTRKQRNAAREKAEDYERQLAALKPQLEAAAQPAKQALQPTPEDPLSHAAQEADVIRAQKWAEDRIDWCDEAALAIRTEGSYSERDKEGNEVTFTKEDIKAEREYAKSLLKAAPQRLEWIQNRAAANTEARKVYPALFVAGSPENLAAVEVFNARPWLNRISDASLLVGDALIGQKVREGKLVTVKAGKKPDPSAKPGEKPRAKTPPSALRSASSSAPAAKPQNSAAAKGIAALHKDVLEGKGDPLDLLLAQ